jgi:hypothetical protein
MSEISELPLRPWFSRPPLARRCGNQGILWGFFSTFAWWNSLGFLNAQGFLRLWIWREFVDFENFNSKSAIPLFQDGRFLILQLSIGISDRQTHWMLGTRVLRGILTVALQKKHRVLAGFGAFFVEGFGRMISGFFWGCTRPGKR